MSFFWLTLSKVLFSAIFTFVVALIFQYLFTKPRRRPCMMRELKNNLFFEVLFALLIIETRVYSIWISRGRAGQGLWLYLYYDLCGGAGGSRHNTQYWIIYTVYIYWIPYIMLRIIYFILVFLLIWWNLSQLYTDPWLILKKFAISFIFINIQSL